MSVCLKQRGIDNSKLAEISAHTATTHDLASTHASEDRSSPISCAISYVANGREAASALCDMVASACGWSSQSITVRAIELGCCGENAIQGKVRTREEGSGKGTNRV